jgi:NSS family neurotransmitter:Na+ symporter
MLVFGTVYSVWHFAGMEAARFLFDPSNFHALAPGAILEALGHSFFTLSLGMGAMITYGSYMDDREHVMSNGFWIVLADTGIAITACFLIYSILFSFGESVEAGPGLIFVTLPHLLEQMVGGSVATGLLFILVLFAAITSAVSMLEVVVSFVVDEFSLSRKQATFLSATAIFLFGVPSALSMGALADVRILGRNVFDFWDYMASNWMLPIGGFFTALFVAYVVPRRVLWDNVGESWPVLFPGWRFILRWVTPILVVLVVLKTTGFLDLIWS